MPSMPDLSGISPAAAAKLQGLMAGMQGGSPDMAGLMAAMQDPELGPIIKVRLKAFRFSLFFVVFPFLTFFVFDLC